MSTDAPQPIRPYIFHGVDLDFSNKRHKTEAVGECPFCDKDDHFYVNKSTGLFDCKVCGESGNPVIFLRNLHAVSLEATADEDYEALSEERGIPAAILRRFGLAVSLINGRWLIPYHNAKGEVCNLHSVTDDGPRCTAGQKQTLFRAHTVTAKTRTVWICEGPWDAMAWYFVLSQRRQKGKPFTDTHAVIAVPGATVCSGEIPPLVKGRSLRLLLDNDEAGREGTAKILKAIADANARPKTPKRIAWDEELPKGYDIRDVVTNAKTPHEAYRIVKDSLEKAELPEASDGGGEIDLVPYNTIEPEEVQWLWEKRIPLGKFSMLQGDPGLGKSYLLCDLAARVSTGTPFPDGSQVIEGEAAIFTSEDDPADTIRPRLDLLGANVAKVYHFESVIRDGKASGIDLSRDVTILERCLKDHPEIRLLVFDPLVAFIGGKVDTHKNSDVRQVLGPLVKLASEYRVSIVGITHLVKADLRAVHSGQGSVAFTAIGRSQWQVTADPADESRRLFTEVKDNLGKATGLAFAIDGHGLHWESEPITTTADEALARKPESRLDVSKAWLLDLFSQRNPQLASEVYAKMNSDGLRKRTLDEAKKALSITVKYKAKVWYWFLPSKAPTAWKRQLPGLIAQLSKRTSP